MDKVLRSKTTPGLPRKISPNSVLVEIQVFFMTRLLQIRLWMLALRIMLLDAEPSVMQWLNFVTDVSCPFFVLSVLASVRLGQYT